MLSDFVKSLSRMFQFVLELVSSDVKFLTLVLCIRYSKAFKVGSSCASTLIHFGVAPLLNTSALIAKMVLQFNISKTHQIF